MSREGKKLSSLSAIALSPPPNLCFTLSHFGAPSNQCCTMLIFLAGIDLIANCNHERTLSAVFKAHKGRALQHGLRFLAPPEENIVGTQVTKFVLSEQYWPKCSVTISDTCNQVTLHCDHLTHPLPHAQITCCIRRPTLEGHG